LQNKGHTINTDFTVLYPFGYRGYCTVTIRLQRLLYCNCSATEATVL